MNVFTNNLAFVLHVNEMEALSHRLELSCHLFADQVSQLLQFCSSPGILDDEGSLLKTELNQVPSQDRTLNSVS